MMNLSTPGLGTCRRALQRLVRAGRVREQTQKEITVSIRQDNRRLFDESEFVFRYDARLADPDLGIANLLDNHGRVGKASGQAKPTFRVCRAGFHRRHAWTPAALYRSAHSIRSGKQ